MKLKSNAHYRSGRIRQCRIVVLLYLKLGLCCFGTSTTFRRRKNPHPYLLCKLFSISGSNIKRRFIPQNYSSKSSCLFYYQPISAVHGTGNECIKAGYPADAKIAQSPGCLRNIGMESETIATMSGEPTPTMRKPAGSTPCQCDETHWRCFTFNINAILEIRSVSIQHDFVTQTGYKMINS